MESENNQASRLRDAWTEFLGRYHWDHVGTLTTDRIELSRDAFAKQFLNSYIRILARRAQHALQWFAAIEGDPYEDRRTHLHFVIGGTASMSIRHMEEAWSLGYSPIQRFDDTLCGLAYLTKSLVLDTDGILLSRNLRYRQHSPLVPRGLTLHDVVSSPSLGGGKQR